MPGFESLPFVATKKVVALAEKVQIAVILDIMIFMVFANITLFMVLRNS